MALTIIVGGQYGSEGKGKVAHYFAKVKKADIAIKVGGANSGHTAYKDNKKYIFKTLPTSVLHDDIIAVITSGSYFTLKNLKKEIDMVNLNQDRLIIDPYAVIISKEHIISEINSDLIENIGSTGSGTGATIADRVKRKDQLIFAKDCPELKKYIKDTKAYLRQSINYNKHIIVEGTQGFGLSLLHSNMYPYVTSRDTTAASVLSEVGLSPFDVTDIILVLRAFPIRVAGNSGELKNEITWEKLSVISGSDSRIDERTSVTNKLRRIAEFSEDVVNEAIRVNNPSIIVMNHLDYIDYSVHNSDVINEMVKSFVNDIEKKINCSIDYYGIDPYKLIKK